jgi:glycosyltransferase involved in cell wall biosynthesis
LTAPPGRGGQLSAGAQAARGDWFLFLHADTALQEGWAAEATVHIEAHAESAAVFTLAFDSKKGAAKFVSTGAMIRTRVLRLPYGDQGLLISRAFYDAVGGFADMPLFEDVDMARRIVKARGRRALRVLDTTATTSAERYERLGYARCILRNAWLLTRFHLGAAPEALAKAYR